MRSKNKERRLPRALWAAALLLLAFGCNQPTAPTTNPTTANERPGDLSQGGAGGGGGAPQCSVNHELLGTRGVPATPDSASRYGYYTLEPSKCAVDPTIKHDGGMTSFEYPYGTCVGAGVLTNTLSPGCTVNFINNAEGTPVLQLIFEQDVQSAKQTTGHLVVVLDDGGGGGPGQ